MGILQKLFGGSDTDGTSTDAGLLILRLGGLAMALAHGTGKIPPGEGFVQAVTGLGFPLPSLFSWAAGLAEFLGGLLLALGLLTRPAAASVLVTMMIAFFLQHAADPFRVRELAFLYGIFALVLLFIGAGRFSLDYIVRRKWLGY